MQSSNFFPSTKVENLLAMSDFFLAMNENFSLHLPVILVVASLISALIHNEFGVCPCVLM